MGRHARGYSVSATCNLTRGVVGLMDFAILQSCSNVSDVWSRCIASHRVNAPVFLGWHPNGVGPLPPPAAPGTTARRQGPPVGRRARGTWTETLDYVQKTLHLGALLLGNQDGRNEYARDGRSGLLVPHFAVCYTTPRRSRPKHHRPDLFAPRYASMPASCSASNSIAPRAASANLGTASAPSFRCFRPARSYAQGIHTGIASRDKRPGLLVLPSAS